MAVAFFYLLNSLYYCRNFLNKVMQDFAVFHRQDTFVALIKSHFIA